MTKTHPFGPRLGLLPLVTPLLTMRKPTTGHRYSMNDDNQKSETGHLRPLQSTSVFLKAVNDAGRCTRVIPG